MRLQPLVERIVGVVEDDLIVSLANHWALRGGGRLASSRKVLVEFEKVGGFKGSFLGVGAEVDHDRNLKLAPACGSMDRSIDGMDT